MISSRTYTKKREMRQEDKYLRQASLKFRIVSSCILTDADLSGLGLTGSAFNGISINRVPFAVTFEYR